MGGDTAGYAQGVVPPPPGVTPNFDNPAWQGNHLVISAIVCPILAAIFVAGRCAAKTLSRGWGWDDYCSITGLVFSVGLSIVGIIPAQQYGLGRHIWDVPEEWLIEFLKYTYAETLIYVIGLWFVKLSLLILYYRVFGVNQRFRWALYVVIGIWTSYSWTDTLVVIFQCLPVRKIWTPTEPGHCLDLIKLGVAAGYINIITDFMILILPIPVVMSLQLSMKTRLAVVAIFATGIFVIATTIVRQVEIVQTVGGIDFTWFSSNSLMWLIIEINVSIICGCMPTLKPLLRRTFWGDGSKPSTREYEFDKKARSFPKVASPSKSNGDSILDASYIELGPAGTHRDVHIAADGTPLTHTTVDRNNGAIVKTDTFGQVISYKDGEDAV